jgi:hypothetical protein
MQQTRASILDGTFHAFVRSFLATLHPAGDVPLWAIEALASVGIEVPSAARAAPASDVTQAEGPVAERCS